MHVNGTGQIVGRVETTDTTGQANIEAIASDGTDVNLGMRAYGTTYSETLFGSSMSGAVNLIGQPKATGMFVGSYTNYPLIFGTNNAERVRIDTAGNVGIGTTTPGCSAAHIWRRYIYKSSGFNGFSHNWIC